jgi:solute:Na+ symporter, SSS family
MKLMKRFWVVALLMFFLMAPSNALAASGGKASPLLNLAAVDFLIIILYFFAVLMIGFYLKKYATTGEDFFMAGRKMTAWIAGLSFISANLSSLETMGWSAMAYQYGMLGAHAYLIGAIPAILFLAVVMMPFYYICRTHSVPGYLKLRYGEGARSIAGISFAVLTVMVSGSSMFAMAKILHLLLGWNMDVSIWASSITVAIYVTMAGLLSAVFNEVLQFFLIWLGTLLVPILGIIHAGGWSAMMKKIAENAPKIHPSLGANADFTHLWRNLGAFDTNPMGIDWFGMVFGLGLAVSFGYWCTDFLQIQRVIVAKDLRSAQNGTLIGALLKMCVPLIVTIPGLLGLAILVNKTGGLEILVPESDPRANITHHTFNDVLPLLMGQYLGPGLLGLGVTAMIAGFMSGMAGNISAFATVWTYDVYRPLINKNAPDRHYLNMGRVCSVLGVMLSIGTAYMCFAFSNILEYLQVLVSFFIVPLFGTVVIGMLWKRATPAAGWIGFLCAILTSMGIWGYVHSFPDGWRASPKLEIGQAAVVALDRTGDNITRVTVEQGTVKLLNIPVAAASGKLASDVTIPAATNDKGQEHKVAVLAPDVTVGKESTKFGIEAVPVVLKAGVQVVSTDVTKKFVPSALNSQHTKVIARSDKAQGMAVNMYTAVWSLMVSILVTVAVSLVTKPKPDAELKNLVMGLTPLPDEGRCAWYQSPKLWAFVVVVILVAINVIFW